MPDIIAEAGVGRSTFYEHFDGAEHLRRQALSAPFAALADAAAGRGDPQALQHVLAHFWEFRQQARAYFGGRAGEDAQRLLVQMVEARLGGEELTIPSRLAAQQLAAAAIAPVYGWLLGNASSNPVDLSANLDRAGKGLLAALRKA